MTGLAGRAAFEISAGLIAAGLAAVYPFLWLYEREVISETLALLWVATTIWLAYKFIAAPRPILAIALGAVVGLGRDDEVRSGRDRRPARRSADPVAGARSTSSGASGRLANGRCGVRRDHGAVVDLPLAPVRSPRGVLTGAVGHHDGRRQLRTDLRRRAARLLGGELHGSRRALRKTRSPQMRSCGARPFDFMSHHKRRVPVVIAARVEGRSGSTDRSSRCTSKPSTGQHSGCSEIGFLAYWVLLPLAIAGAVIARRRSIPVYPLLVFPVVVVLSVPAHDRRVAPRTRRDPSRHSRQVAIDATIAAWHRRGAQPELQPEPAPAPGWSVGPAPPSTVGRVGHPASSGGRARGPAGELVAGRDEAVGHHPLAAHEQVIHELGAVHELQGRHRRREHVGA